MREATTMLNYDMLLNICYIFTYLCWGISVSNIFVFPMFKRNKANKSIKFKLEAISKYDGYLIDKECLLDNASLNDRNEALKRDAVQAVSPWIEDIAEFVGEENSQLMYTNLKTASFEVFKRTFTFEGSYQPILNRVRIKKINALLHELLHLASAYYDKNKDIAEVGFLQQEYKTDAEIGRGLNEGYTELMSSRIDETKPDAYQRLVIIARLFEQFFDNSKDMENLYFRHDLPGFVHYMEGFIPYDKLMDILLRLDRIYAFYEKQVPVFIYLEVINIEKELYGYFVKSNPSPDKLRAFEDILRENKLSASFFSPDKMNEIKENAFRDEEELGRKMSA